MTAAVFSTTAVPVTARPLTGAQLSVDVSGDAQALLRPLLLVGAVAFVIGFMGYLILGRPHEAVAEERYAPPAAVSTPAATPTPDIENPPKPV